MTTISPTSHESSDHSSIVNRKKQFQALQQLQFTGQLILTSPKEQRWVIYLYLGRIMYATGGSCSVRRWVRQVHQNCLEISSPLQVLHQTVIERQSYTFQVCWEYEIIYEWVNQGRITREQGITILQSIIREILFELNQTSTLRSELKTEALASTPLILFKGDQMLTEVYQEWLNWHQAKINHLSPHLAPIIQHPTALQSRTSKHLYQILHKLLDGKQSFYDIARLMKSDLKSVMQALSPYIQSEYISLLEIPDISVANIFNYVPSAPQYIPKIACIDDSPMICNSMKCILTKANYEVVCITDPVRAFVQLLSSKPDLIFLDLVMPNTNGYEICRKLRNLTYFKDTPIVILTGQDGVVDRVRAKLSGASDFLSKPVEENIVLQTAKQHLSLQIKV